MSTARRRDNLRGFTLIELVVVLVILALAAGAITLRLQGPLERATLADTVGRIVAFDARTRVLARRHDKMLRIEVDLSAGVLTRIGTATGEPAGMPLELPEGVRLAECRLASENASIGRVAVPVSSRGLSKSYALCVVGADGPRHWLIVAGLTGQVTRTEDAHTVETLFAALAARADAR